MRYTTLGNRTGLRVSEIALGTSNFGTKWATGADEPTSARIFTAFADAGGTAIDTADTYQRGESELFLAKLLAADREHFTLASKYTFGTHGQTGVTKTGNSRKTMRHALESSLTRLGTDYLDLYWVHAPDFVTPLDEIVEALDDLVRAGKILHGGLSNFPAWQVSAAVTGAAARGRTPIVATQFEYSLAARDGERDLLPMAEHLGIGAAVYSPLGGGLLTGKYRTSAEGRLTTLNAIIQREDSAQKTATVDELLAIGAETGVEPAVLAIAWLLERGRRTATTVVPIIGPRTTGQLDAYLRAVDLELADEHYRRLDEVSTPHLGIPHDGARATLDTVLGGQSDHFRRGSGPRDRRSF
ncbi:aldo/keto reductase [Actinoplanes awajinensis]|uniref:Oxidoreductase n=1 Tax=Actinoplanes awajinensis subsp. mycoplanecinus TaxID=135947 RepID=A0A117MQ65_9ACTN|nr:aldo/keto reductase [Actinoplanes awajinensis]KUL29742.1 oxidoreductase [Actinoplanes awajinensis subsp. mycoplanecinus]